jgi:chorismate mutase/prephenate dehydratase
MTRFSGVKAAFQGEVGAYSEEAAIRFFDPSIETVPCRDLTDVFKMVERDDVDYGIVPIENSLEGDVNQTFDLLLSSDLKVWGEMNLKITHCLVADPKTRLDSIEKVYSHPQALAQCRNFLIEQGLEPVPAYDTAGSVKNIRDRGLMDAGAVASRRAAEIYGMKVLAEGIEDIPYNYTRFLVLAKEDASPTGEDKTSIIFSTKHVPGALYKALEAFASRKINLTKIQSRPTREKPWSYNFFMDFEGHREDVICRDALEDLEGKSLFVKVLGSYPKAKRGLG